MVFKPFCIILSKSTRICPRNLEMERSWLNFWVTVNTLWLSLSLRTKGCRWIDFEILVRRANQRLLYHNSATGFSESFESEPCSEWYLGNSLSFSLCVYYVVYMGDNVSEHIGPLKNLYRAQIYSVQIW